MRPDIITDCKSKTKVTMIWNDTTATYNETYVSNNGSEEPIYYFEPFGLRYRVVATVAYSIIFLLGITGNSIVIFTIYVSNSLHTSAYAYLTSLACADLLVICTVVPEGLVYTISSGLWYSTSFVCSAFVFMNFFCINVGTLSMMAFTLERYIATCRPFLAQKICTLERSRKIIAGCWVLGFLYCSPWLGLAQALEDENIPGLFNCRLTLSLDLYTGLFTTDLVLFYLVPLVEAMFVYWNIGRVLRSLPDDPGTVNMNHRGLEMEHSMRLYPSSSRKYVRKPRSTPEQPLSRNESFVDRDYGAVLSTNAPRTLCESSAHTNRQTNLSVIQRGKPNTRRNVAQSLRILVATVLLFAICWLPFRGLLIYNSLVEEPWLDLWYALFSKCMIFLNCCINPLLYTLLSKRFRECVKKALTFKKLTLLPTRSSNSSLSRYAQTTLYS